MKTLNKMILLSFMLVSFSVSAQTIGVPKIKKLQIGVFAEGQKEFATPKGWRSQNIAGYTTGVAFRYRLSNRFLISTGIGASLSTFFYRESEFFNGFTSSPYQMIGYKKTETLLRLPICLQTNVYKQKFFVTGGVELFKIIDDIYVSTNVDNDTKEITKMGYNYGPSPVDVQFMGGVGWNFNALRGNVFSLEANLKYYKSLSGFTPATSGSVLTPSLRLNWYFVK